MRRKNAWTNDRLNLVFLSSLVDVLTSLLVVGEGMILFLGKKYNCKSYTTILEFPMAMDESQDDTQLFL